MTERLKEKIWAWLFFITAILGSVVWLELYTVHPPVLTLPTALYLVNLAHLFIQMILLIFCYLCFHFWWKLK